MPAYHERVREIKRALGELDRRLERDRELRAVRDALGVALKPIALQVFADLEKFAEAIGEPGTRTVFRVMSDYGRDVLARTLAAVEDDLTMCPHVKALDLSGPAYLVMGYPALACRQCLPGLMARSPDPSRDDRCDWCGQHGVAAFTPVWIALGLTLVIGGACPDCQRALLPPEPPGPARYG